MLSSCIPFSLLQMVGLSSQGSSHMRLGLCSRGTNFNWQNTTFFLLNFPTQDVNDAPYQTQFYLYYQGGVPQIGV